MPLFQKRKNIILWDFCLSGVYFLDVDGKAHKCAMQFDSEGGNQNKK